MIESIVNVFASVVVLAMITAMTRPGSQGPKLADVTFKGFAGALNAGLGGAQYGAGK